MSIETGWVDADRGVGELAVGIRNGLVTPRARIYHNASQKWLPIGLHPHYKKAMELPAVPVVEPPTVPPYEPPPPPPASLLPPPVASVQRAATS